MIERYQLRYFLAVVDAGSFSRAATAVNVTQPALSIAIAKLETAIGAKLFLRSSQRVHLTDEGARLLVKARAIEGEFNSLAEGLAEEGPRPVLRVGVLSTIPSRLVCKVVDASLAAAPAEPIEIVEGVERDLVARLLRRRIDLALTLLHPREARFASEPLFEEGYSLVAARGNPLTSQASAPGEAFAKETMIVRRHCEVLSQTSRYFTERGVRPRFSLRSTNDERVLAYVKAGLGVTVAPDSYADPDLAMVKLAGFDHTRTVGLLFADEIAQRRSSPVLQALRAVGPL